MANTYTKIYFHIVFSVKNRNALIPSKLLPNVFAYMSTVLRNMGHFPVIIGGVEDHVHILVGYNVNQSVPDMVRELKTSTSKMISRSGETRYPFGWQRGYACFSYSHSHIKTVSSYIFRQADHHKRHTFREELSEIYRLYGVDYDDRYAFDI